MPKVNSETFRNIAAGKGNAEIFMDANRDRLHYGVYHTFSLRRAVTWVASKLGHKGAIQRREKNREVYAGFIRAIGNDDRYLNHLHWLKGQLQADAARCKPLTVRKVRKVMTELEAKRTEEVQQNTGGGTVRKGANTRANVYDPGLMKRDPNSISEAEVHGIMPHLLSDLDPMSADGGTSNIRKVDILHAKQEFSRTGQGKSLTENEIDSISGYIENSDINRHLGMNNGDGSRLSGRYRRQYDGMQSGLEKLPDERSVVYRGTTTSHDMISRFRDSVGSLFCSTAFLSTSASPDFAKGFSHPKGIRNQASADCDVRYQILGRTGKNISGIDDLAEGFEDPETYLGNGEILFRPGTNFRLVAFAKHPEKEVYGMVLREEPPIGTEGRLETAHNLQDARAMTKAPLGDGLANELVQMMDEKMFDQTTPKPPPGDEI